MEYIIHKDGLYIVGKVSEINHFLNNKTNIYRTLKEFLDFENEFERTWANKTFIL